MPGDPPPTTSRATGPSSQAGKTTMSSKISTKQNDEGQGRSQPPPKAWGSGVNPITQRSNTPSQVNGSTNKTGPKSASAEGSSAATIDKAQDRFTQLLTHAMGICCTFATKEEEAFVGIPVGVTGKAGDIQIVFHQVRVAASADFERPQKHATKAQYVGEGAQHIMTVAVSQITLLLAPDAAGSTRSAQGKGFKTDTEISGSAPIKERKLERWQAPADNSNTFGSSTTSGGDFDQFKVNELKFGVKSTYNEEEYTTRIDRSRADFAKRNADAARIAAEIEGNTKSNAWSEQRGINDEGYDEEDLYSGVRRDATPLQSGQSGRYVPPSRRSQQGTPKEAAVDPAILSAQVAVPKEPASTTKQEQAIDDISAQKSTQVADASTTIPTTTTAPTATTASSSKAAPPPAIQTQQASAASKAPADVAAAFKQFANLEKMKVQTSRHMKNQQDKAVKVNDLKKFAKNFKLHTPVPKDLLPILAKDEAKQNEIVKKAQEQAELNKKLATDQKQPPPENSAALAKRQSESGPSGQQAVKAGVQTSATQAAPSNTLGQRLETNRRQQKMGAVAAPPAAPPAALPIHDGRQGRQLSYTQGMTPLASPTGRPGNLRGPNSGTALKFNPKVTEFRPNAMAAQFVPGSSISGTTNVSSPSNPATRTITPVSAVAHNAPTFNLFREAKIRDAKNIPRKAITWQIDHAKTIKPRDEEPKADPKADAKDGASGIQQSFKQRVDWIDPSLTNEQVEALPKYKGLFARDRMIRQPSFAASPNHAARGPPQGQYPMQNGGHNVHSMPMPGQMPPHMAGQHHYQPGGHFDDHHQMRPSPSMQSAYPGPSPRMHNAYPSPMAHGAQMAYPQGPYMSPAHGMGPRQYSNGPAAMPGPHMQPHMMMQQGPNGPYMQQPMMPMQPHPQYGAPQGVYGGPPQPNGYPSPGRGAPAMMPSGSHQGHPQQYAANGQYAQPHYPPQGQMVPRGSFNGHSNFPQSPYQQHPYPARTPSHGYAQPHQQPAMMTPQAAPAQPAVTGSDEAK